MLLYFENFFLKKINLIIYLYSFIESKFIILKIENYYVQLKKKQKIMPC